MTPAEPSEVTAAQVRDQLDRTRQAAAATEVLLDPATFARLTNPGVAAVEFSRAVVSAFAETRIARTPEGAADVLLNAASRLQG